MARPIPPALGDETERLIREELEEIPGVRVIGMEARHEGVAMDAARVVATIAGWSPSLHLFRYTLIGRVDPPTSPRTQADQFMDDVRGEVLQQSARSIEAHDLGIGEPIAIMQPALEGTWDHLSVDRMLVDLMAHRRGGVLAAVEDLVDAFHANHDGEDQGGSITGNGGAIIGTRVFIETDVGEGLTIVGASLVVDHALPDTVANAAVGRTLGDVAEMPAAIAGRRIERVTGRSGGWRFHVTPDWVRVGDLSG